MKNLKKLKQSAGLAFALTGVFVATGTLSFLIGAFLIETEIPLVGLAVLCALYSLLFFMFYSGLITYTRTCEKAKKKRLKR